MQKCGQLHASIAVALMAQSAGAVCPAEMVRMARVVIAMNCRIRISFLACLAAGIFVPVGFFKGRYSRLEGGAQVQNVLVRSFDPRAREPGRRMLRMKRWDASSQMRRLDLASTPIREACRRAAGRNDWDSRNNGRAAP